MKEIFDQGSLRKYAGVQLRASRAPVLAHSQYASRQTTVFISHKHDELDDLKGLLGFLQQEYNVKVYIDSQDPTLPSITSSQTALDIRDRIKNCDKFILLATNAAIESKWCNWELGYGDAQKYKNHIALFPMKPAGTSDSVYIGSEYMAIYPHISYSDGTDRYSTGELIPCGYYVQTNTGNSITITPLNKWFQQR